MVSSKIAHQSGKFCAVLWLHPELHLAVLHDGRAFQNAFMSLFAMARSLKNYLEKPIDKSAGGSAMSRRKLFIPLSLLAVISFIAVLIQTSKILSGINDRPSAVRFMPFYSKDVWGAKAESLDGSRKYFVGIQKVISTLGDDEEDLFPSGKKNLMNEKIKDHQHYYKIELAKVAILIKVLSYSPTNSEMEQGGVPEAKGLKQLNYILKNRTCKTCSKDNGILLSQDDPSNPDPGVTEVTSKSIFALLVQIELR